MEYQKVNSKPILEGQHLVILAAVFYGLNPLFAKLLFNEGIGVEMVSLYRFIIPAVIFSYFLKVSKNYWNEALRTLTLGIAGGISILAYFNALSTLPAATAILIYYAYPVFSVIIGWLVFKREPTQNALISAALVAIAASLTVRPEALPPGALFSLITCFVAPIVVAFQVQYLSNPRQVMPTKNRMAWITIGHILVLLPLTIWIQPEQVLPASKMGFFAVIGIALVAAAIPQLLFMVGAPKSCANKNALTGSLELVVAMLTGAVLLGDNLDRLEITAMVLIVLALFIRQVESIEHSRASA